MKFRCYEFIILILYDDWGGGFGEDSYEFYGSIGGKVKWLMKKRMF